jgi:MSHA biogenesis protein MshO
MKQRSPGFTLVELIMVMVIVGVVGAIAAMELGPALQSYGAVAKRANLTHQADTALRRMMTEVRTAVPNSLRALPGCMELVPTSAGGRFRFAPDVNNAQSDPLDLTQPDASFDVLTKLNPLPAAGDWIVIGNQNGDDVYFSSVSRAQIQSVDAPASPSTVAQHHIVLTAPKQFPFGYEGGRFFVVPDSQQAVTYACNGGTLYRYSHYGFPAALNSCAPRGTQAVVATKVAGCQFIYNPSQGATQESGYVQLQLSLSDGGESVTLTVGSQVENVP